MLVVHCKLDPYDVYVGRPSVYGNPFSWKLGTLAKFQVAGPAEAIEHYREWLLEERIKLDRLRGKTLGCWCAPKGGVGLEKPYICHGQVLLELANA